MYRSLWNKVIQSMKLILVKLWIRTQNHEVVYDIYTKIGWKLKLEPVVYVNKFGFLMPIKLVEPIAKLVCKIMKKSAVNSSSQTWLDYWRNWSRHVLRATSHTRPSARDHCTFKHSHWWQRRSQSTFIFTLRLRDQHSTWMQDGCKIYKASNGSRFIVTRTIFKTHLLEGGLTQNWENHGTLNTHNCWFIILYHAREPTWIQTHWNSVWLRAQSHTTSHYLEGPWPHYLHDFGSALGTAFGHFPFGLSQFLMGSCVWSGP
jgi:hypothetical protein